MDVTQELADYAAKHATDILPRGVPIEVDAGLLAAFDNTPVDTTEYASNREAHLLSLTLTSTHSLLSTLWNLPTKSTDSGKTAILPIPTTILPREKPLPKPKQPTKWERFAKEKGISHKKREKHIWDEEKQEWVARWGRDGNNREGEEQWIHEVKQGDAADIDPALTARQERKSRIAKNEKQHLANLAKASRVDSTSTTSLPPSTKSSGANSISASQKVALRAARKAELDRSMLISKTSTASLGKFDKKIEGEPRLKGIKRKFESNEGVSAGEEKEKLMSVLRGVERGEGKKVRKGGEGREGDVNTRKAVRYEDRLQRLKSGGSSSRGGRGGRGKGRGGKR